MTLNFYTLGVIYLVYSFLGWVAETVVATIRGGRFANRGAAAGPFCFIYGTTGVLLAVSFGDLRTEPVYLFFACMMAATVMEWITAKLLERLHRRKWWDYSGKKFNLNGYVCLQYSLLWGALGTASVLWGNNVLLQLCAHIPVWLLRPAVWVSLTVAVLDQIGSAVLVQQYAARHPMLEQLNQRLGERSDTLRRRIALYIEKRIQYAYPAAARQEQTALRKGEKNFLSVSDLLWLFVIGAFLGDMVETVFCRVTAGVWMSRSSLVWGPFSVVWGLALVITGSKSIAFTNTGIDGLMWIGGGSLFTTYYEGTTKVKFPGIPFSFILVIIVFIIFDIFLRKTALGRQIYCVGGNPEAARLSGIPSKNVLTFVYTLSGFMAGMAGIVSVGRLASANGNAGSTYDNDAIAACIVGGASFTGGKGTIWGTLIGALLMAVIRNGLNLAGAKNDVQYIVIGSVIILAVTIDVFRNKMEAKARKMAAQ